MRAAFAVVLLGGCVSSAPAAGAARPVGQPGDTVHEDDHGFIDIEGKRLAEPYLSAPRRLADTMHFGLTWHVPKGSYFMLGDNRSASCDSRTWGSVPARNVIGPVVKIIRGR